MTGYEVSGVSASGYNFGTDILFGIEAIKYDLLNGSEEYSYLTPVQRDGDDYLAGTRFAEVIDSSMAGEFGFNFSNLRTVELFGGDDSIDLSDVNGEQMVFGGSGDDTIKFGAMDRSSEGNGTDEARFYGSIEDYTIVFHDATGAVSDVYVSDGYITVTDNLGAEGTDEVWGAERIRFDNYYTYLSFAEGVSLDDTWFYNGSMVNFDGADLGTVVVDGDGLVVSGPADGYTATYGTRQSTYVDSGVVIDMSSDDSLATYEDYSTALRSIQGITASEAYSGRFR
jgi:hypothetical protein